MEGGGGGVRGAFPYGNNNNNFQGEPIPLLRQRRPPPPLTAIDRFLWGAQNLSPEQEILTNFKNKTALHNPENVYSDFASSATCLSGAINGHAAAGGVVGGGVVPWLSLPHHDTNFADGIFLNEQNPNWGGQGISPNVAFGDEEDNLEQKNPRQREKGGSSANLIKGQWTEDEDRLHHGISLICSCQFFLPFLCELIVIFSFFFFLGKNFMQSWFISHRQYCLICSLSIFFL